MADRIAVDEEENKRQRLENERKRMKEVDLLSKILPDTKSQTKEMAGIQTQANALIDPKLYTDMTVNWRATAALMGKPLDELDATQYGDYKAQIAVKLNRPAPKSESEYRSMLSEYFVKEKDKDTALNELYGNVVLKAFQDTGMGKNRAMVGLPTDYVKEWEATHKDLIDGDAGYHAQANRVYNQTLKDIESIRGKGAETFSALMDFTQGKADDERISQVAEHLSSSSPEERQKVYRYVGLAAQTGQIDRAGIEQFAINMGKNLSRTFDFVPQGTLQGQEDAFIEMRDTLATGKVWLRTKEGKPTLNDVYRPSQGAVGSAANIDLTGREATPEEVATLKAQAESNLKTFGVIRELRNVAKSEVDPIRPVNEGGFLGAAERGAYGLAGSIGIMVPVAINPVIGMMAYQAQEYDRIVLENPDMARGAAKGLSLLEGAGNAALDRLQLGAINGKLPVFGGLLNGIKNNGIRRVLTTVGVEVLEQNLQEGAQDLIAPLTETLTAALREDMPDKDFGALMKDYMGSRAETFFAVLPLALLGGGIGTYRDLKNPAMQMADKQLEVAGFGPAQRDYINQASSMEEKAARIEQEWGKRTETDITAGKELLAASIAEARNSKGGDTIEVNTKADGASEWIVRDPAGKEVARVSSEEEAATIITDRGEAEIRSQANVVADLLDSDWRKDKLPNFEAQFGGEVSPEVLMKEAEAKGDKKLVESIKASIEAHGADPANLSKLRILGESWVTPYGEGQYKAFVKLNEGSTALDAFEELAHNIFDIDVAEGRITKEQAREWVSQAAAAGVANYKFGTDAEVRESMAQIAQDFAQNRLDQTNLPSSFVAFLKKLYTEFVEFMRRAKLLDQAFAEGKIDAEFERYLMGKVGLSDASMIEREVNRIEGEQGERAFSIRARDEAYDAAVKSGDEAEQQRLVDEAAKEAGYTVKASHGSSARFNEFSHEFGGYATDAKSAKGAFFFSDGERTPKAYAVYASEEGPVKDLMRKADQAEAKGDWDAYEKYILQAEEMVYGEQGADATFKRRENATIYNTYLKGEMLEMDAEGMTPAELSQAKQFEEFDGSITAALKDAKSKGYDGVVIRNLDDAPNLTEVSNHYAVFDPSNIKLSDPITRDDEGNVIPLSQRFNPESNDIRYSIQSQDQIDRVNKAVADTTQFAEGRMALYEKAKERFKAVLAENKEILDALKEGGAAPEKIRRQKLIQGIAELEVILRQLPAEVRGKVGGFSQIASIDPVSLFKGGEVVATSKNEKGAIVSAWLKEGLNLGQANKKTQLPEGYRVEVKEDDQMRDTALADFFKKRLQIIDKELEKHLAKEYLAKIEETLQNAKPRKGPNGVKKSTLGAVTQEFADKAYEASLLDNDATVARLESLEKQIAKADDPKKEADLVDEWAITNTFGALAEQSSAKLKTALDFLKKELAGGRAARKAAEQARIDDIREKQGVIADALPGWTDAGLNKVNSPDWWNGIKDLARQMVWSHASYEQILRRILPPEAHGIVEEWSNRIRKANGKTEVAAMKNWQNLVEAIQKGAGGNGFMKTADALSELGEKREGKVSKLEGREVELESIPIDKAEQLVRGEMNRGDYTKADLQQIEDALIAMPIESQKKNISIYRVIEEGRTESIPMTLDEMIFTTMAWEQSDVRVKMENSGWTQESYDAMQKEIASSKVATAVKDYLKEFYRNSTKEINPVFSRMFGMGLPDNPDYAPTSYESRKAGGEMSMDGSAAQSTTTPGFAKARVTHNEAFKITPATQIYQQRSAEQAQWVAFAELHREMNAVLNGKNVRLSMKQENGKRLSELMSQVLDNIAQGGGVNTDAAYIKGMIGAATSGTAVASMGYNLKTIFNQFDSVTRFLYAMPLKDVMRAIANPQKVIDSLPKAWHSEVVQNRILEGSNPAARFALKQAGMTPSKFLSAWYGIGATGLKPMQYADGALTTLSSAIVYADAHAKALKAGLSEKDAEARAMGAMDAAIWRFSQPVMFSAKSPVENNSHAAMKLLYMFASDARLKTGIIIDAVQSIKDGKGSKADHLRRIGVVFLGAMLAQTVSNIYRDLFSDDDDDEIWTASGYGKAAMLAPFQGLFLLGTAIDVGLSSMFGERAYTNSSNPLVTAGSNAIVAAKHSSDILQTDDMEAFFKELGRIARAISLTPVTAVPAAVLNPVKPIVGAKKNIDKGE